MMTKLQKQRCSLLRLPSNTLSGFSNDDSMMMTMVMVMMILMMMTV
jgi:hypothetical protein